MYEFKLQPKGDRGDYCTDCCRELQQDAVVYEREGPRGPELVVFDTAYDSPQADDALLACVAEHGRDSRTRIVRKAPWPIGKAA